MNRKQRRKELKEHQERISTLPEQLTRIPEHEFPATIERPEKAWRSRKYLVQQWTENNPDYPGMFRLSVCRVGLKSNLEWQDGLTWDELQAIKRELGYGAYYAVEVYPADHEQINVANFRHLWLLPTPLSIGWFKERK